MPSKTTPKTPATNPPSLTTQATIKAAAQAYDMATLGLCCVGDLRSFLRALDILTRDLTGNDIVIHECQ